MGEMEVPDGSREHHDVARGLVVPEDELPRHLTLFELDELEELDDPPPPPPPPPLDEEELELLELEPPPPPPEDDEEEEEPEELDEELDDPAELELDEAGALELELGELDEDPLDVSGPAGFASSQATEPSPTASVPPVSNFRNSRRSSRRWSALPSRMALSFCGMVLPGVSARRGAPVTSPRYFLGQYRLAMTRVTESYGSVRRAARNDSRK